MRLIRWLPYIFLNIILFILLVLCLELLAAGIFENQSPLRHLASLTGRDLSSQFPWYQDSSITSPSTTRFYNPGGDYEVEIDEFLRRKTPLSETNLEKDKDLEGFSDIRPREYFALFFGDSFTFGDGLGDKETLPFHFGQLNSDYHPYNYGLNGAGLGVFLKRVENRPLQQKNPTEIPQSEGIVVLNLSEMMFLRASNFPKHVGYLPGSPVYLINDGKLEFKGYQRESRPIETLFFTFLTRSFLFKRLEFLKDKFTPEVETLGCKILENFIDRVRTQLSQARVILTFYPELGKALAGVDCLYGLDAEIFDFGPRKRPDNKHPDAFHPSSEENLWFAKLLSDAAM